MATMISEVYDAFKEAGVSDETARKAAETLASYESQFAGIRGELSDIRGDLKLVKWMIGTVFVGVLALGGPSLWLLLGVAAKVGALGS
jgi:hypothetical protein